MASKKPLTKLTPLSGVNVIPEKSFDLRKIHINTSELVPLRPLLEENSPKHIRGKSTSISVDIMSGNDETKITSSTLAISKTDHMGTMKISRDEETYTTHRRYRHSDASPVKARDTKSTYRTHEKYSDGIRPNYRTNERYQDRMNDDRRISTGKKNIREPRLPYREFKNDRRPPVNEKRFVSEKRRPVDEKSISKTSKTDSVKKTSDDSWSTYLCDTECAEEDNDKKENDNKEDDKKEDIKLMKTFEDELYPIPENILKGIYGMGFETPSEIQQKAIPAILTGRDVIVQAPSGNGKTGAFSVGVLSKIDEKNRQLQGLILSPTRELAKQIHDVIKKLAENTKIKILLCIGGEEIRTFIQDMRSGCHILICTLGRLDQMVVQNIVNLKYVKILVLDEADQMLSDTSREIYNIVEQIPKLVQTILVTATVTPITIEVSEAITNNPIKILMKDEELTLEGIKQYCVIHDTEAEKFITLTELYNKLAISQTIIYANRRETVDWLKKELEHEGYSAEIYHSKCENNNEIMKKFRSGSIRILITTDALARGIDIQQLSMVINYDIPTDPSQYIHRICRSGRYGKKGIAINFVTKSQWTSISAIQKQYKTKIEDLPLDFENHIR